MWHGLLVGRVWRINTTCKQCHTRVSSRARVGGATSEQRRQPPVSNATGGMKLDEVEHRHILDVLDQTGWRIRGPGAAAEILGLRPTTLESRMAKLGIKRPAP